LSLRANLSSYLSSQPVQFSTPHILLPLQAAIVSSDITQVNDLANAKNALTHGSKAAAAILPLSSLRSVS